MKLNRYPVGCGALLSPNMNSQRCSVMNPCENCEVKRHANRLMDVLEKTNTMDFSIGHNKIGGLYDTKA
ncbi:hypothetical protein I5Q42_05175 [Serratia marcescens]|nr:hypothetical protein [Serratia marcescens]MBH2910399.1 hypothetical protein [Serratia marcescens]